MGVQVPRWIDLPTHEREPRLSLEDWINMDVDDTERLQQEVTGLETRIRYIEEKGDDGHQVQAE